MNDALLLPLLTAALPLLIAVAAMLVMPTPLMARARPHAQITTLTLLLLSFGISLLLIRAMTHVDMLNASRWISSSLAMLSAGLIAGPLLDRARKPGLLLTACAGGVLTVPSILHGLVAWLPPTEGSTILYTAVISSVVIGLGGSLQLPLHPGRFTPNGLRRAQTLSQPALFIGWLVGGCVLLIFHGLMAAPDQSLVLFPIFACAWVSMLIALLRSNAADGLRKAGEAFCAGILIGIAASSLEQGALYGLFAGFFVLRSEAITASLHLDDPQNLLGTLLIPALLSLLFSATDTHSLATKIIWLAGALGMGIIGTLFLWPATKLLVGLAPPPNALK